MAIDGGYGDTMSGKSLALEMLMRYLHSLNGKKSRVYIGDGGAETYNTHGLVDDGIIEVMDFSYRDYPQTVLKLITDFYYLKDPKDQNSKLVPPAANLYETHNMIVYEGGTVMGSWLLSDVPGGLAWHAAMETGFGGVKDEDGELSYTDKFTGADNIGNYIEQGANSPKHFYLAQRKILNAIRSSKKFPGLVFWTFHPTEAADKTQGGDTEKFGKIIGKKIIGPDAGGKALASTIGKEFGNLLHFDQVTLPNTREKDEVSGKNITQIEKEFRVYTRRHMDPDQNVAVEYVAGSRMGGLADYYVSKEPGDTLLQFYNAVKTERDRIKSTKETA